MDGLLDTITAETNGVTPAWSRLSHMNGGDVVERYVRSPLVPPLPAREVTRRWHDARKGLKSGPLAPGGAYLVLVR